MIFAIGIGSNLGNRILNIEKAIILLEQYNISVLKKSSIYQNKAWILDSVINKSDYDIDFFNVVILCDFINENHSKPLDLLAILKKIEKEMGRVDSLRWAPRIIDLDLLFYDNVVHIIHN